MASRESNDLSHFIGGWLRMQRKRKNGCLHKGSALKLHQTPPLEVRWVQMEKCREQGNAVRENGMHHIIIEQSEDRADD